MDTARPARGEEAALSDVQEGAQGFWFAIVSVSDVRMK
jgi:hypothetical protein